MHEGQTLHIKETTASQVTDLREKLKAGSGSFEFIIEDRLYVVNCASVMYIDVTPASAVRLASVPI
ncbi:hypothetical protein BOO71_0006379 [Deinococcus marmoris]|uniref:Uncharacterized protein n=2 Tax=Deinococcus marmoris TaxID=249408 RepID=A0A1U7NZ82_9DEIO|nr:hypothetical protein BOO71_0006379 [Deinococcus marmoris]